MKVNFWTLIIGLVALFIGYRLTQYANAQTEKRIIEKLTAEIQSLKDKRATRGISSDEEIRVMVLEETVKILAQKNS